MDKIRRLRIQAAVGKGAVWARKLNDEVTHVICDRRVEAAGAKMVLNDMIDFTRVPVILDTWLVESMKEREIRDVQQGRFQLKNSAGKLPKYLTNSQRDVEIQEYSLVQEARPAQAPIDPATLSDTESDSKTELESELESEPLSRSIVTTGNADIMEDDFAKVVEDMKVAKSLPFDDEIDLAAYLSSSSGDERETAQRMSKGTRNLPPENRGFTCIEINTGITKDEPNARTMEILQRIATYYDTTGDSRRTFAYRKAISALRRQKKRITTYKEAIEIGGIGTRIAEKIEEIVTTDHLARLDGISEDPNDRVLQLFMTIYDVGLSQALKWLNKGYRTLEDLGNSKENLSPNQKIGIERHWDFSQRIPRSEVAEHGARVQQALTRANKDLKGIIGGSFRRGKPNSGDIDVLIVHPDADLLKLRDWVFNTAIPWLFEQGFLKCALATSRSRLKQNENTPRKGEIGKKEIEYVFTPTDSSGTKFLGASQLRANLPWRRIDLLLVPSAHLGASLIYFTGNDIFNRSIRLLASKKGMRLNQYGLYKNVLRGPGRSKETEGELVEGCSEKKIFELLGVPWTEPHQRNC